MRGFHNGLKSNNIPAWIGKAASIPNAFVLLWTIIIIMAGMAVFYVAGYLIEERHRWPVITSSPRGQCSK